MNISSRFGSNSEADASELLESSNLSANKTVLLILTVDINK